MKANYHKQHLYFIGLLPLYLLCGCQESKSISRYPQRDGSDGPERCLSDGRLHPQ